MKAPASIAEYIWQSVEFPLCTLDVSAAHLAQRLEVPLVHREEAGLGAACGFGCRLSCGLVVFLEELEYVRASSSGGLSVYVEASELVARGVSAVLEAALSGLGLPPQSVTWVQPQSALGSAKAAIQAVVAR